MINFCSPNEADILQVVIPVKCAHIVRGVDKSGIKQYMGEGTKSTVKPLHHPAEPRRYKPQRS